jgi:hypothetical protein
LATDPFSTGSTKLLEQHDKADRYVVVNPFIEAVYPTQSTCCCKCGPHGCVDGKQEALPMARWWITRTVAKEGRNLTALLQRFELSLRGIPRSKEQIFGCDRLRADLNMSEMEMFRRQRFRSQCYGDISRAVVQRQATTLRKI